MEKQKYAQKEWYENKPPTVENEVIEVSTATHIERLKNVFPVQEARLSLNCGCGRGEQREMFGPSIGMDISFENIQSLVRKGGQGVVADMEFLPFKDQAFELVYGFAVRGLIYLPRRDTKGTKLFTSSCPQGLLIHPVNLSKLSFQIAHVWPDGDRPPYDLFQRFNRRELAPVAVQVLAQPLAQR